MWLLFYYLGFQLDLRNIVIYHRVAANGRFDSRKELSFVYYLTFSKIIKCPYVLEGQFIL